MGRKTYKAEQIIGKLREAEVLLSQGSTVGEASKKIGVTEQTYYRWRKQYGKMRDKDSSEDVLVELLLEATRMLTAIKSTTTEREVQDART